jgi:chromosome partitioning protein
MRLLSKIEDISAYAEVNKHKVKDLMVEGVIPAIINESANRSFFYTTDTLIDFSAQRISKLKNIVCENNRDIFLYEDLNADIFKSSGNCLVYSVTNQKGGVAKTTISVNLSATLALLNQRVLLIDMDSQAQSSRYLNKQQFTKRSIEKVFLELTQTGNINKEFVKQFIVKNEVINGKSIDILPSELSLSKMLEYCRTVSMAHTLLKRIIDTVKDSYDFVILDLPPNSGMAIEMSLYASDKVILATDCDDYAKEGIEVTLEGIKSYNEVVDKNLMVDTCFISKYNKKVGVNNFVRDKIIDILTNNGLFKEYIRTIPFNYVIPESQKDAYALIGFFQKEKYNIKTESVTYVSTINQSILANEQFFDCAIKMINDKEANI